MKDWVVSVIYVGVAIWLCWWAYTTVGFFSVLCLLVLLAVFSALNKISADIQELTREIVKFKEAFRLELDMTRDRLAPLEEEDSY